MDENTEQLYGREGIEASQGYSPMPEVIPATETGSDTAPLDDGLRRHLERPDQPEPIERSYVDSDGSGKRRAENETITADRASDDLSAIRKAERAEYERQLATEINEAVETLRQQTLTDATGQSQQQQPEQSPEVSPEDQAAFDRLMAAQPLEQPQPEQALPGVDPDIAQALQNPKVRGLLEQTAAHVEQTKATYQQVIAQNANAALAVLTAQFPEFAGLSGPQLEGALRVSNPQRAEAFRHLVGQVNTLVGAHQQQAAQQQAQQYERAVDTFRQFAAEQDARVLTNDPPETVAAIRSGLVAEAKAAGISEKELITVYNTNSAMRHSFVQNLIADGMRYRLTQRALATHRANPVPQVVRPGVSEAGSRDDGAYASLERQFRGKSLNPKEAASLLIARRSARS